LLGALSTIPAAREKKRPNGVRLAVWKFHSLDDACRALRDLSRDGIPAFIEDVSALTPDAARRLLDLFLHDPCITEPIEPFAALLSAAVHRRRMGLWDLDPAGARAAEGFLRDLPQEHPGCLACPCFCQCEGYGEWAGGCDTWRAVIAGIAAAAREIATSGLRGSGDPLA